MAEGSVRPRAVVVDEEALFCVGVGVALAAAGVDAVANTKRAREGLRLADQHDAALLVIGTPADMPRAELIRRARREAPARRVVTLLARLEHDEVGALLALDIHGVLMRSAPTEVVTEAIRRALSGERTIDPAITAAEAPEDGARDLGGAHALTARERDVLTLLSEGRSNREIAASLFVSLATVKTHLAHIYAKLDARNRNEALGRAVSLGLLP